MEFMLIVYLISTVFPVLKAIAGVATILALCVLAVVIIFAPVILDSPKPCWVKTLLKKIFIGWCVAMTFHFVPNEKTSYAMLAAYTTQQVVTNDKVQEIAGQSLETVELLLQKYNQELKDEVKTKEEK